MRGALADMGENFRQEFNGANSALQDTVREFQPVVEDLGKSVSGAQIAVTEAVNRLESHGEVVASLDSVTSRFAEATDKFVGMRDTFSEAIDQNRIATAAQKEAAASNITVAGKFEKVSESLPSLQEALETSVRVIGAIGQPLLDLKEVLAKTPEIFIEQAQNQADTDEKRASVLLEQTNSLVTAVSTAAEKFSEVEGLANSLDESAGKLAEASGGLSHFADELRGATQEQTEAAKASREAASSGKTAAETLVPIPKALEELSRELQQAAGSIKIGADAASDTYRELLEHQKLWFEGIEKGLGVMRDRLQELIAAYGDSVEGETRKHMERWTDEVENTLNKFSIQSQDLQGAIEDFTSAQNTT